MTFLPNSKFIQVDKQIDNSGTSGGQPESFGRFAALCEVLETTEKKSDKSHLIAVYLSKLSPDTLVIASRCLAGYIFPLRERRTLNISGLIILNSFAACAGVPTSFVRDRVSQYPDIGQLAFDLFSGGLPIVIPEDLTLTHVSEIVTLLSSTSGTKRKSETIVKLLRKASPLEAKYIVRILTGDLLIGVAESDVEDAISRWKDISYGRVQSANMLTGDIGETALLCCGGRIDEARLRLFNPPPYMHGSLLTDKDDVLRILPSPFIVEDKFDGIRAQVHIGLDVPNNQNASGVVHEGLRVAIYSDILDDVTNNFFDLVPAVATLMTEQAGTVDAVGLIVDGVIVPTRNGEIRPFGELLPRLSPANEDGEAAPTIPVGFIAFDLLFSDGRSLIQEDWSTRITNLEKLKFDMIATFLARSTYVTTAREVESILEMAQIRGSQGVMLKNPRSSYRPGRRGRDWLKIYNKTVVTKA